MTVSNLLLAATLVCALLGLLLLALSRRGTQTRSVGFKQARALEPAEGNVGTAEDWVRMTADQIVADAMTGRARKGRGRVAAIAARMRHCETRVVHAESNLADADAHLEAARADAEGQRPPALSGRVLKALYVLLYTGDLVVITAAILAENAQTPPGLALLSATALATALFVVGKFLGHHTRTWMDHTGHHRLGAVLIGVFIGLSTFGLSLMTLRLGNIWAWLVLSISPALGAAALMTLGPTVEQTQTHKRDRTRDRAQRRLTKAKHALDRLGQTKDRLDTETNYHMRRTALRAEAELTRLGIDRVTGRQYLIEAIHDCNTLAAAIHSQTTPTPAPPPHTADTAIPHPDHHNPTTTNGTQPASTATGSVHN